MENKNENIQALNDEEMENATGGYNIPMEDLGKTCPKCGYKMPHGYWGLSCPRCGAQIIEE